MTKQLVDLEPALRRMSKFVADVTGSCPYDWYGKPRKKCANVCDNSLAECWYEYFVSGDAE